MSSSPKPSPEAVEACMEEARKLLSHVYFRTKKMQEEIVATRLAELRGENERLRTEMEAARDTLGLFVGEDTLSLEQAASQRMEEIRLLTKQTDRSHHHVLCPVRNNKFAECECLLHRGGPQ